MDPQRPPILVNPPLVPDSLVTWAQIIYGLHMLSLISGVVGAATIVGAFLFGWPSIIAVIMNYLKQSEARGTWLESHFRWQIRTFWFGFLWASACFAFVVVTFGLGIFVVWIPWIVLMVWLIYRVVKGWKVLSERRSI